MKRSFGLLLSRAPVLGVLVLAGLPCLALGGGKVVALCGAGRSLPAPCDATNVVAIASGYAHNVVLKEDGTVADCGSFFLAGQYMPIYVPIVIPPDLTNVVAVAAGTFYSLALKNDGTVVVWQADSPLGQIEVPAGLSNVVAITPSAALKADGTVVPWGASADALPGLDNVVAISSGSVNLALKADGTVVGWSNAYGVSTNSLAGLSNVVAISSGLWEWLALRADGSVVGSYGVLHDPTNVLAIAASPGLEPHVDLALKSDGTVVGWGNCFCCPDDPVVPPGLSNVVAVSTWGLSLALVGGGPPFLVNRLTDRTAVMTGETFFRIEATGAWPLSYQWRHEGTNLPGATNAVLALSNLQPSQAGSYSVEVSNVFGVVTSANAGLSMFPLQITQQPEDQTNFFGGTAVFGIKVRGIEPLQYQWRVNGVALEWTTNSTLVLTNLNPAQAGVYSVTVSNSFGAMNSSNATLKLVPILLTTQPQAQVVLVGGTASLSVAAQGVEPLRYQWRFNGADLAEATNSALVLTNLQIGQSGQYSVSVSNENGVVTSSEATLSVVVVAAWGHYANETPTPGCLTNVVAVAAGLTHNLALLADGSVVAWGNGYAQTNVPTGLTNVVAIASGSYANHSLAIRLDGTLVSWGTADQSPPLVPVGLTNVVAASAGGWHTLALAADGTVVGWGSNGAGQASVPPGLRDVVAVSAGEEHSLALKADGTVMAWGAGTFDANPPDWYNYGQSIVPPGLSNVCAIAAGDSHCLALRRDGTVVAWGRNHVGQAAVPADLKNIIAIAAGAGLSMALLGDGTVVSWGWVPIAPVGLSKLAAVAASGSHCVGLVSDNPPLLHALLAEPTLDANGFSVSLPTQSGRVYRLEYRESLADTNWEALPLVAGSGHVRTLTDPTAIGGQRFYRVRQW